MTMMTVTITVMMAVVVPMMLILTLTAMRLFHLAGRDMNRRLRDEKDAQQSQRRVSHSRHSVLPSLPLNYYLSEDLSTPWTQKMFPTYAPPPQHASFHPLDNHC